MVGAGQKKGASVQKDVERYQYLEKIFESLTFPLYVVDVNNYKIRMANPAAYEGELTGKETCYSLIHNLKEPCGKHFLCPLEELKKTKRPVVVEQIRKEPNGRTRFLEIHAYPIFDDQGSIREMIEYKLDVTDRRMADLILKENEEKLRSITAAAFDGIIMIDDKGLVTFWNSSAEKIFGYKANEMIGKDLHLTLAPAKYHDDYLKGFKRFIETGEGMAIGKIVELEGIRKGGEEFPMELSLSAVKVQGKWHAVGIVRDISERKKADASIKFSESRYKELFENMSSGVAVYEAVGNGADFIIKEFNKGAEAIEHEKRGDVVGKSVADVFKGVKQFGLFQVFQRVYETGIPECFIGYYQDDKRQGWRENSIYKLPTGELVSVYNDVTDRKTSESRLRDSESKFRSITESAFDAVIMIDDQGKVVLWNKAAEKIFGYTEAEMLGEDVHLKLAPKHFHEEYKKNFPKFSKTGEGSAVGKTIELEGVRKNGKRFSIELSLSAVKIGERWHAIGIVRDIDERKEAEFMLKKYQDHLEEMVNERLVEAKRSKEKLEKEEAERRKAMAELEKTEDMYRTLINEVDEGIFVLDMDTKFIFANQAMARILGFDKPEDIIGMKSIDMVAQESKEEVEKAYDTFLKTGKQEKPLEFHILRQDGTKIYADIKPVPVMKDGKIVGSQGVLRDITERKKGKK